MHTIISKLDIFFLEYVNFLQSSANIDCIYRSLSLIFSDDGVNDSLRCFVLSSFFIILRKIKDKRINNHW